MKFFEVEKKITFVRIIEAETKAEAEEIAFDLGENNSNFSGTDWVARRTKRMRKLELNQNHRVIRRNEDGQVHLYEVGG